MNKYPSVPFNAVLMASTLYEDVQHIPAKEVHHVGCMHRAHSEAHAEH